MILIILPIKNEIETLHNTVLQVNDFCKDNFKSYKILFIDDESNDGSQEYIEGLNLPHIHVLSNFFDRGKGSALKAGFVLSNLKYKLKDDDYVVFMDGDGQIDPVEIKTFLNLMNLYTADVVIGNKRHTYSINNYSFFRTIVSNVYNMLIKILFGISYKDTQCGIKIFKKYALDRVIKKITVKKFAFDLELVVALRAMNMRIADAPVILKKQVNSGSVSIYNIVMTFFDTVAVYIRSKRNFYQEKI